MVSKNILIISVLAVILAGGTISSIFIHDNQISKPPPKISPTPSLIPLSVAPTFELIPISLIPENKPNPECKPIPEDSMCLEVYTEEWYFDGVKNICFQPHGRCGGTRFGTQEDCEKACTK